MKNSIIVVVGSLPAGQLLPEIERATGPFKRYETSGDAIIVGKHSYGQPFPASHIYEETGDPDDPNRREMRVERGPFLVITDGAPTPEVGANVVFRKPNRLPEMASFWPFLYETFEVSEVIRS